MAPFVSRRSLLASAVAVAVATVAVPTLATDRVYDIDQAGGTVVDKVVVAPGSVFFVGINPLKYPTWSMMVNDKISSGPTPALTNVFSNGLNGLSVPDVTFSPTPAPSPPANVLPDPAPSSSAAPAPSGECDMSLVPTDVGAAECVAQIRERLNQVRRIVYENQDAYRRAASKYRQMWAYADEAVQDAGRIKNRDDLVRYFREVDGTYGVARREFLEQFYDLHGWPEQELSQINADISALGKFYSDRETADHSQALAAKNVNASLAPVISANQAVLADLPASTASHKKIAGLISQEKSQDSAASLRLKYAEEDEVTVSVGQAVVADLRGQYTMYADGSDEQVSYANAVAQANIFVQTRVLPATTDRFAYFDQLDCKGLAGGQREKDYQLQLGNSQGAQVRLLCEPRMFLSAGIAFSGLAQATYGTVTQASPVPVTSTPVPATTTTTPTPAPNVVLQAQSYNKIRATAMILNNVRIADDATGKDNIPYISFGAAITNGNSGTNVDYLGGVSYSLTRVMLLTAGVEYGTQTQLPDGYSTGQVYPSGTNAPQMNTRSAQKFFLGISFGNSSAPQ